MTWAAAVSLFLTGDFFSGTAFFLTMSAQLASFGVAVFPWIALMATAFLMAFGGEVFGVPSFILFTLTAPGEDLFLFRFFPALGVFLLDSTLLADFGEACFTGSACTGVTTGEDLVLDLAAAGLDTTGVLSSSETPVKLMSRLKLLLTFLAADFRFAADVLRDLFFADITGVFFPIL